MNMQKDELLQKSYTVFFVFTTALLSIFGSLLLLLPQHSYSENENRYLTTLQPVSLSGFLDMSMQENLTDSANDQFWQRDVWVKFATSLQRTIGFQDVGGVYFGKNGYYFERVLDSQIPKNRFANNLRYLEQFATEYETVTTFLPVPSAGTILTEQLPKHAVLYDASQLYQQAKQLLQQANLLDIRPDLTSKGKTRQIYFKTDHHWTMEGAYLAYTIWCNMHGITGKELSEFSPKCVSETFFGTLYSKAPEFGIQPDAFWLPTHTAEASITIDGKKADSLYDWGKLQTKDKYGVYFGGNFGRIDIKLQSTGHYTQNNKKLLLIKDSFANSFVPFLMEHFNEIILLDFRYYNQSIAELMQTEQPTEVLVLYEISNFAQEINFFKILK